MNTHWPILLILALTASVGLSQDTAPAAMQNKIQQWHQAQLADDEKPPVLRVVYFHGNDMEPLPNYEERLGRVMQDISEFYRDGMKAHGMTCDGIPLEKHDDGRLVLHLVKGQHEAAHYDYESGSETEAEIRKALGDRIDFDREFVLVLYGQCWKMDDGRFGFYSPYYGKGGSSQRWGFCHAADCHLLDPELLTDTKNRFKYWEHYGDRDQSVAMFNSFYIGGIAHELGHGLGLPHDGETMVERFRKGRSLMGNGNLTYRDELWKPRSKGSFLSLASAAQLASHPLFTGSSAGRFEPAAGELTELAAEAEGSSIRLRGKVVSETPSYAVIAYIDPAGGSDYDAKTAVTPTGENGEFSFRRLKIPKGKVQLRLVACFANGEKTKLMTPFGRDESGEINIAALFENVPEQILSAAERAVAAGNPEARNLIQRARAKSRGNDKLLRRVALLESWLEPAADPIVLAESDATSCYLSDAQWENASSGWAGTPRDKWGAEPKFGQGLFLVIAGKLHEKGLPAHCPAEHTFATAGRWDRLEATVGLRDGTSPAARSIFIVNGDGRELFRSDQLAPGETAEVDVEIGGVEEIQLLTESGMESTHTCWAVWGSPKVTRKK
ncbi:MAG: NPCBM/NEW2 domain-containing protein [Verrucomicrobiales bacterium]